VSDPPNPFEQDLPRRLIPPTILVICGVTGDLAARKLLPAVYELALGGELPEEFRLVGVARGSDPEHFMARARESVEQFARSGLDADLWGRVIAPRMSYLDGDLTDPELFTRLHAHLDELDAAAGVRSQRLVYLAVAPSLFGPAATSLGKAGLARGSDPQVKVMVEKPFGRDLESSRALDAAIHGAFDEPQILRVDHYLGKETVQNLLVFRFGNGIFEPVWNRRYVDNVQLTVAEELGIGHRADYYDRSGALRDVVQNHALQLLSLIAMEPPATFAAEAVRDEKVKLLRAISPFSAEDVLRDTVRARYTSGEIDGEPVPGYLEEDGVPAGSTTETFAALRLEIANWRWAGVPFYVRTGKRLPVRDTEIVITFRPAPHLPFGPDAGAVRPNQLVLSVQPDEGASLRITAKAPGPEMRLRPVRMDFQYGSAFMRASPEAYERLLLDAMRGDATLFARADEVDAAWRVVDPVLAAWARDEAPLDHYRAGSQGPGSAEQLMVRDHREWRRL
jgi:glucose-6-phosphate 1-dehydrogenase